MLDDGLVLEGHVPVAWLQLWPKLDCWGIISETGADTSTTRGEREELRRNAGAARELLALKLISNHCDFISRLHDRIL